nr:succinate dehydrogenase assembly factor 4 [uncultured Rhodospira sp.]
MPLTPESGAGPGDVAQARKAVRRAAGDHAPADAASPEVGGPGGPEPTRYNDWERKGRCSDF